MFSRYLGPEAGPGWVERMRRMSPQQASIAIRLDWVNVIDLAPCFPTGMSRRMQQG